eukprot:788941-Amphidinium_carterae.1
MKQLLTNGLPPSMGKLTSALPSSKHLSNSKCSFRSRGKVVGVRSKTCSGDLSQMLTGSANPQQVTRFVHFCCCSPDRQSQLQISIGLNSWNSAQKSQDGSLRQSTAP